MFCLSCSETGEDSFNTFQFMNIIKDITGWKGGDGRIGDGVDGVVAKGLTGDNDNGDGNSEGEGINGVVVVGINGVVEGTMGVICGCCCCG
jgi:hypothetical protein